jgi:hypothetical protein
MPGRWGTRIAAVCFIFISAYICADAIEFPVGGGTFPLFAASSAIVLCLVMLVGTFLRKGADHDAPITFDFSYERMKPLVICGVSIIYVLAIFEIGYFTSTVLFLIGAPALVGVRSPRAIVLTGIILLPVMYAFFVLFLHANLPKGILF